MAPITNARVLFAAIPKDFPIPGETTVYDTSQKIDLETVPLNGGLLIKTLVLSIDPYMRGRMRAAEEKSYADAFILGAPIDGYGVCVILRSENPEVAAGRYLYGIFPHQQYTVLPSIEGLTFLEKDPKLPWTVFVGAAGMPGKTAFMGWKEFSRAKKGETAFISTGAGVRSARMHPIYVQESIELRDVLVDSMVIQLAKRDGLKVIACAGSDEKVKFMREIGADVVFNYKMMDTREVLAREGPIDVYWDNVGGKMLDAALEHAAINGRILECGTISGYNTGYEPVMNIHQTWAKSLTISGILVFHLQDKYEKEFYATIPQAIATGEIKYTEEISQGLKSVGDAILRVQQGKEHREGGDHRLGGMTSARVADGKKCSKGN
ncbi:Zinc-type alcohol dehydrogenase-like protein PB24D3.08c [Mycena venus]|uniref:Zinc-type alcohol dehydrogenase-like protein PB24D3.08c n=1 Tax=Mycena venus TaxID=2733690 RepID=A0A8H6Y9Q0_9AGAR|nr:Zinc-type alcohol dehydrogenase-like protein PB24D3.08c [Mycena venus]